MLARSRLTAVPPGLSKVLFLTDKLAASRAPISVTLPRALNPWSKNAPPATSRPPADERDAPRVIQARAAHEQFDADPAVIGPGPAIDCETGACERPADRCVVQVQPALSRARDLRTRQVQGAGHRSALEGNQAARLHARTVRLPVNGQPSRQDGHSPGTRSPHADPAQPQLTVHPGLLQLDCARDL